MSTTTLPTAADETTKRDDARRLSDWLAGKGDEPIRDAVEATALGFAGTASFYGPGFSRVCMRAHAFEIAEWFDRRGYEIRKKDGT